MWRTGCLHLARAAQWIPELVLTCRLTSEPDTMGTSWPNFYHLSRSLVCRGVGGTRSH